VTPLEQGKIHNSGGLLLRKAVRSVSAGGRFGGSVASREGNLQEAPNRDGGTGQGDKHAQP